MEEITVVNKVSQKAKAIRIEIKKDGIVVLTRPRFVSEKKALSFLEEKRDWVIKSYKYMLEKMTPKLEYITGDTLYYLGNPFILKVSLVEVLSKINQKENFDFKKTRKSIVVLDKENNRIEIYIKKEYDNLENRRKEVLNFLAYMAGNNINLRLNKYSNEMQLKYNDVRIKDVKSKWGSCSSKKNLNFNYKLIFAPQWIIDYVVVHELSHLKHMDHSKNFWGLVQLYAPKYKEARKWFKDNNSIFDV